jgi:hypothetical protein
VSGFDKLSLSGVWVGPQATLILSLSKDGRFKLTAFGKPGLNGILEQRAALRRAA